LEDDPDVNVKKYEKPDKKESYIFGFVLSLILTLVAYFSVAEGLISGWSLVITVGALALVQVVIQLIFFLHLGEEPSPPLNLIVFLFMLLIVFIIVIGSIWIMYNLDYQMAMPSSTHPETKIKGY
jgi:cytochrome o ubiquinol oxidase subunit IV